MPVPDITSILSTTTPVIAAVIAWVEPLWVLLLGIAVAFLAGAALISWMVGGVSYLIRGRDNNDV